MRLDETARRLAQTDAQSGKPAPPAGRRPSLAPPVLVGQPPREGTLGDDPAAWARDHWPLLTAVGVVAGVVDRARRGRIADRISCQLEPETAPADPSRRIPTFDHRLTITRNRPADSLIVMQGGGRERLVILGNGMVGHRFLEMHGERAAAAGGGPFDVTVIGEEPRLAYDRVGLSGYFDGKTPEDLALARPGQVRGGRASRSGWRRARAGSTASAASSRSTAGGPARSSLRPPGAGDRLGAVRAADSRARRARLLRLPHDRRPGARSAPGPSAAARRGVVIGGGLLGLEAANALQELGMDDARDRVRAAPDGAAARRRGRRACCAAASRRWASPCTPRPTTRDRRARRRPRARAALRRRRASSTSTLVVFSAGIRPRDELARAAGLPSASAAASSIDRALPHQRPGRSTRSASARLYDGRCYGLVAPGYQMARAAVADAVPAATPRSPAST